MGPPRTRYWKISRSEERAVKKLKRNYCGKKEGTGDISSCNPYKMEIMQEDGGGGGRGGGEVVKEKEKEEYMAILWCCRSCLWVKV
jgi:hypothetical protein